MAGRKDKGGAPAPANQDKTEAADTAAAGAIEGAGAALEAGGDARDVAAAAIGGAAAGTAEATGENEVAPVDNGGESGDRPSGEPEGETGKAGGGEDHITAFDRRIERLVQIVEDSEFESGTLVGDIRDALLDIFKNRPKPWSQMSAGEQADLNRSLEATAKTVLRKLVLVLAEEDNVSVHATLKGYAVDGETFKLKVVAKGDEDVAAELFRMDGYEVILIRADARRHFGQRRDGEVQPDQPGLVFADPPAKGATEEIRTEPAHPADDSDLAGGEEADEEEAEELFRVTAVEDGATLYLRDEAGGPVWTDKVEEADAWTKETADQLAGEHDGTVLAVED